MYFPELERLANENPKWRAWIATLDHVLERNIGRVVAVGELREFVTASEKQFDEFLEVLSDANRIERLDWLCCRFHESVLFDPAESSRYCDLCGKKVPPANLKSTLSIKILPLVNEILYTNESPFVADQSAPKVLVSYSHDSEEYSKQILDFADQLRDDGIDVTIDQYQPNPPEGWPMWMERQVERADFVLMAFTERYFRRCRGEEVPGIGKGVAWESILIANELYNTPHFNTKFIPVVLDSADKKWILPRMQGYSNFTIDHFDFQKHGGYQNLIRLLTNQPSTPAAELGKIPRLPNADRRTRLTADETIAVKPDEPETIAMTPSELQVALANLLDSMFENIVFDLGAANRIQGRTAAQSTRAIDLVTYATATNQIDKLIDLYRKATGKRS